MMKTGSIKPPPVLAVTHQSTRLACHFRILSPNRISPAMPSPTSITPEYEAANGKYAAAFDKGHLALPPSRYCRPLPPLISLCPNYEK